MREALEQIPEVFYQRTAVALLVYWVVVPLPLWWVEATFGVSAIELLDVATLHVGLGALALGLLLLAASRSNIGFARIRDPRRDNLPILLLLVLLTLASVAAIVSPTAATVNGDPYRNESLFTFFSYVGFFFLASQVFSRTNRTLLVAVLLGVVVTTCVVTLVPAVATGWTDGDWATAHRATAYFHQFNHYGYLLAVGGALAASGALVARRRRFRWTLLATFGIVLLVLLFNDTLGAYVALAAGCVIVLVWLAALRRVHPVAVIALVAVVVAAHVLAEAAGVRVIAELTSLGGDVQAVSEGAADAATAGTGRWGLWMITVEQIATAPWFGHGIEGISDLLPGGYGRPHNEYLQYAVFFGIPALLAYLAAVTAVFVRVIRRGRVENVTVCTAVATATYLVSACFGNTMYYTAPLLFLLLGLTWAGVRARGTASPVATQPSAMTDVVHAFDSRRG